VSESTVIGEKSY